MLRFLRCQRMLFEPCFLKVDVHIIPYITEIRTICIYNFVGSSVILEIKFRFKNGATVVIKHTNGTTKYYTKFKGQGSHVKGCVAWRDEAHTKLRWAVELYKG